MTGNACALSMVVPMRDEARAVDDLVRELEAAFAGTPGGFELIAVDDGSTDGTWDRLARCSVGRPWLRGVRLERSFGQHPATLAGLARARGRVIAVMDADRQVPVAVVAEAVRKVLPGTDLGLAGRTATSPEDAGRREPMVAMKEAVLSVSTGAEIVFAERLHAGETFLKRGLGVWLHRFLSRHSAGSPRRPLSTFLACRRELVEKALRRRVTRPVTPFHLMLARPDKVVWVSSKDTPRLTGQSKYNLRALVRLSADILFGYTDLAARLCAGANAAGVAALLGAAALALFFVSRYIGVVVASIAAGAGCLAFSGATALLTGAAWVARSIETGPLYRVTEIF